ncbi:MAG TPA: tetratricopeptide repeat protein [Pyrinomonadaceae bacterium]|nr:tetratricopeptide repeat protein [Pyrinomonadaceae bacterium]
MSYRSAASIVLLSSLFLAGCSSAPSGNSNAADATPALAATEFTDANAALAEGVKLLDMGDTERAIELFNRAVELNPDLADAYFQLGIAYSLIETRDAAVVEEQVTPTPTPGEKKQRVATTNSEKAFEKAVAAYKKQIDANGKDDVAYFNLGRAYNKLNEDEDAAKALRQAVELKADDTEYQTELGAILIKLAQYREAISPLRKAIELDPENSRAIDLLEDAEAGRRRIDFVTDKKDANKAANTNANTNSNTATAPTGSNTSKPADTKTPPPPPKAAPANKPS